MSEKRTFFVWDLHGEFRDIIPLFEPGEIVWLEAHEIGLNPFEVPIDIEGRRVMRGEAWASLTREWMRLAWMGDPTLNIGEELLLDEYRKRGLI